MQSSLLQRAGLWVSHSIGALVYTVVFAAIVFVPCFLVVDRWPKAWIIRTLRVLGVASLALLVFWVGAVISSGSWPRGVVMGTMLAVFMLLGAALGFSRAASHGVEVALLRPQGEPVAHWRGVLHDHPRWWLRSRAARELGMVTQGHAAARDALQAARDGESNRHVRRAVSASLARLP